MDLTVKLTELRRGRPTTGMLTTASNGPMPICDRCHNVDEIVVAVMQILPLEQTWALCGPCRQELPKGFHLA